MIKKAKTKINSFSMHIFFNLQYHPTFYSEERLVQLSERKRVCCWSIYLILYERGDSSLRDASAALEAPLGGGRGRGEERQVDQVQPEPHPKSSQLR